jgi:hypothetical protein
MAAEGGGNPQPEPWEPWAQQRNEEKSERKAPRNVTTQNVAWGTGNL